MNKSKFPELPFLSAKATAAELFSINMDEDTFVELGWYAYRDIGNVAIDNYVAKLPVDEAGYVLLPENVDTIDAVCTTDIPFPTLGDGYQIYDSGIPVSRWFFTQVRVNDTARHYDLSASPNIVPGELISYDWVEHSKIKIVNDLLRGQEVWVSYKGTIVDDMCLPRITFKESQAIAARVAFLKVQKDLMMHKPGSGEVLGYIKQESERLMQAAKIPEYLNQNEFDAILDAQTSWGRKSYGRSFKPYSGR